MKKRLLAVSFIALVLTIVGCSNDSKSDKSEDKASNNQEVVTAKQKENTANKLDFESLFPNEEIRSYAKKMIGTKAPNFIFKNLKGEEIELNKLKGQNVVVEIASTTCTGCIDSFPSVQAFKSLSKGQVKTLTIFPNEKKQNVEDFFKINKYQKDEEVIAGEGMNNMINDYQVEYTPTFMFIDKKGYIQFVHVGGDIDEVVLSSMSDLAFKTNLNDSFNKTEEVKLEIPKETTKEGNLEISKESAQKEEPNK